MKQATDPEEEDPELLMLRDLQHLAACWSSCRSLFSSSFSSFLSSSLPSLSSSLSSLGALWGFPSVVCSLGPPKLTKEYEGAACGWSVPPLGLPVGLLPVAWAFWLCEELDSLFVPWFRLWLAKHTTEERAQARESLRKAPRVRLGLCPSLSALAGLNLAEPTNLLGALLVNKNSEASTYPQTPKVEEKERATKSYCRLVSVSSPSPFPLVSFGFSGVVPVLCLWVVSPGCLGCWVPSWAALKENQEPTYGNPQSRQLTELLLELPVVPPLAAFPGGALGLLGALATTDQQREKLAELKASWPRSFSLFPLSVSFPSFSLPSGAFLSWLGCLVVSFGPPFFFPLSFFSSLRPSLRAVGCGRERALLTDPLVTSAGLAWPVLSRALASFGFPCPPFREFLEDVREPKLQPEGANQDYPRTAYAALLAWGLAVSRCTQGADESVPVVVACLDFLTYRCPPLGQAIAWAADLGLRLFGKAALTSPPCVWCAFCGVPLVLAGLASLPTPEGTDGTKYSEATTNKDSGVSSYPEGTQEPTTC